jgi:hypothetical protein
LSEVFVVGERRASVRIDDAPRQARDVNLTRV